MDQGKTSNWPGKPIVFFEGPTDLHVAVQLLNIDRDAKKASENFGDYPFHSSGDWERAIKDATTELKLLQDSVVPTTLALVLDADTDPNKRWKHVLKAFKNDIMSPPSRPAGTPLSVLHIKNTNLTIALWMMPDNQSPGALEHLLLQAVVRSEVLEVAKQSVDSGHHVWGHESVSDTLRAKADLASYIAFGPTPDMSYGVNLRDRLALDPAAEALKPYADWLLSILGLSEPRR